MDETITEKKYPVQKLWIFKSMLSSLIGLVIAAAYLFFAVFYFLTGRWGRIGQNKAMDVYFIVIIGLALFHFIITVLKRANFHYSIEEKFLVLKQGILSKQQRYIPYGVIQNLFVKQDLLDRIFGLASLTIENASQGAGAFVAPGEQKVFGLKGGDQERQQDEMIGFSGNKVVIPGLAEQNAEALKEIILQKMKENPIEDSQSGL